jgi:hypothetical protein
MVVVTFTEANVLWDRDAYNTASKHIRMRLKCPEPAILVDEKTNCIVAANQAWQDQCGYREEAIGLSPKILHGDMTDKTKAYRFAERVKREGRGGTSLVNYKEDGTPFMHTFVADKLGAFFFTTTKRAVDVQADLAPQAFAIAVALMLTYALVFAVSALSIDMMPPSAQWSDDTVTTFASAISFEVVSVVGMSFIAFCVAYGEMPQSSARQICSVVISLVLTYALVRAFSALSIDISTGMHSDAMPPGAEWRDPSVTSFVSALFAEVIPLACLSILACLVMLVCG